MTVARFPADFLWGAATAAHQVEGGNRRNDWWQYEKAGRLPFSSGDACDHLARYESDFDMAKGMGHNCHRFSIEWSRVEPFDGRFDDAALELYARMTDALRERGLEPVITLNHFTLPAWFAQAGGWQRSDAAGRFATYVSHVVRRLGAAVRYWLTINEPTVYVNQGYLNGAWPPMRTRDLIGGTRVFWNLARAHVAAYDAIKSLRPQSMVSFAHSAVCMEPCDPGRSLDRVAARTRDYVYNDLFFRLIGTGWGPSGRLDFVALNYYTRCCVRFAGSPLAVLGRACGLDHHANAGPRSDLGWEMYSRGLGAVLRKYQALHLPIFVTENGIATEDDALRCRYIEEHVDAIADAIRSGVRILGYLHWSLLDNFEWDRGTAPRFGLAAVDFLTQSRTPRPSAGVMAQLSEARRN